MCRVVQFLFRTIFLAVLTGAVAAPRDPQYPHDDMLRSRIENLLAFFVPREVPERAQTSEDALSIHLAAQRVDSAYERFRNLLDPDDEDILRRKAIIRFLGRQWGLAAEPESFAFALLKTLAYGKYIPDTTHRRYARDIAAVIRKAFTLWQLCGRVGNPWLLPLLAVEIDRLLYPRDAEDALVYAFFEDMRERVVWEDVTIAAPERDTQLFFACHRALAKTEDAELFWHLYRTAEPVWVVAEPAEEDIAHAAEHFVALQQEIVRALRHPAAYRLMRRLQVPAVPYRVLRDILQREDAATVLCDPSALVATVRDALISRIRRIEQQMLRRVWHVALFLFLSKGVLAFAQLWLGAVRVVPIVINVLFPPTLLFLMTGSVPRPGEANTRRLVDLLQGIVSNEEELPPIIIRLPPRVALRRSTFILLYILVALALLSGVLWVLHALKFSLVGGFFFVIFLGLVSFLGIRLRSAMRELRVVVPREGVLSSLFNFLTLPVLDLGRQISLRASQINVFLFLLDAVIEAPFKVLIGLVEEWFTYLRERREDLV